MNIMWLNGALCFGNVLVFFISLILLFMSLFKSKDGDSSIRGRRFDSGCMGMWLFVLIALFTACNWTSYLTNFFSPDADNIAKFSWITLIVGSTIIMIILGRGIAYERATQRVLFVMGIPSTEGMMGSLGATLAVTVSQLITGSFGAQTVNDSMRVFFVGYLVSLAIGVFFVCIHLVTSQTYDMGGVIPTGWIIAVFFGSTVGGALYGGLWGGIAGGVIGIITGFISLRKFLEKDYLDAVKFEELSDKMSRWRRDG